MSQAFAFNQILKKYGKKTILDNVGFSVNTGEFVGLVGINGAGKTTMIKSLLDLTNINSGKIKIFGVDHRETKARLELAYLPERFNPPAFLKANAFVKYMLELHNASYDHDQVLSMINQLDLGQENLSNTINCYSKGMVQKLGLATAFLSQKRLLILDEPMSGLDPKARMLLKKILLGLKEKQVTLFVSTHLLADAALICDRLIVLHNAKIVFQGAPASLLEQYSATDYDDAFVKCITHAEVL